MTLKAILVIRSCGASGNSLVAGETYTVPGQVSESDAVILIRLGKASPAKPKAAKPLSKTAAE